MISFDKKNLGMNSNVLVSFRLDFGTFVERLWNVCGTFVERLWNVCGTFVERLFLYCFGITTIQSLQDGLHGVQAVQIDERKCTVLCGTTRNLCLGSSI
jgi:hypothetical protein